MPIVSKKASDVMVPLADYPVVTVDDPLEKAVLRLSKEYLEPSSDVRHRTILVVDQDQHLVGILDFRTILESLVSWHAGDVLEGLDSLRVAAAFAEAGFGDLPVEVDDFNEKVKKKANVKVKELMLKVRGTVQADTDLLKAIRLKCKKKLTVLPVYDGDRLIGVLRDVDLFLAMAETLRARRNGLESAA